MEIAHDIPPTAIPSPKPTATPLPQPTTAIGAETEPGGRKAVFPNTIIVYQRTGRIPGGPQQWTFYHTGRIVAADGTEWQVPAAEVEALFRFAESQEFWELRDSYGPAGECLDCLVHTITVYREGKIKEVTITANPPASSEELGRIVNELDSLISE